MLVGSKQRPLYWDRNGHLVDVVSWRLTVAAFTLKRSAWCLWPAKEKRIELARKGLLANSGDSR